MAEEWRIKSSRGARLDPVDPNGLRRQYIADLLKRNAGAREALDALGSEAFHLARIDADVMRCLHGKHGFSSAVNQLAGFFPDSAFPKQFAEHNRTVIEWLAYDIYMRATVAPDLIKAELRLWPKSRLGRDESYYTRCCNLPIQGACADAYRRRDQGVE